MTPQEVNPYESPRGVPMESASPPHPGWRTVPMVTCGFFGVSGVVLGAAQISQMVGAKVGGDVFFYSLIFGSLFISIGGSFLLAAWWFWERDYSSAIGAMLFGLAIPLVAIAIFVML